MKIYYKVWIEIEKVTRGGDEKFPDDEDFESCDLPFSCVEEFESYDEALAFATDLQQQGGGYIPRP